VKFLLAILAIVVAVSAQLDSVTPITIDSLSLKCDSLTLVVEKMAPSGSFTSMRQRQVYYHIISQKNRAYEALYLATAKGTESEEVASFCRVQAWKYKQAAIKATNLCYASMPYESPTVSHKNNLTRQ